MLILSRKPGESIVIDGRIHVKIVRVEGEVVKIGCDAPPDVPVHRKEVYDEIQSSNQEALTRPTASLPRLTQLAQADAPNLLKSKSSTKATSTQNTHLSHGH